MTIKRLLLMRLFPVGRGATGVGPVLHDLVVHATDHIVSRCQLLHPSVGVLEDVDAVVDLNSRRSLGLPWVASSRRRVSIAPNWPALYAGCS
ncbi:hypothetical protein [Streptomyces sp. NPDC005281]|uniref:hypothetical protein n=1 Tax=Streptomyces sp. NPDC005281 TaxID=3155712 RepID=UPI00339EFFFC